MTTFGSDISALSTGINAGTKSKSRRSNVRLSTSPDVANFPSDEGFGVSPSALSPFLIRLFTVLQQMGVALDELGGGIKPTLSPARLATTADLGAVYAVGNFTGAPAAVDGVATVNGDRILVKDQADPLENGVYQVVDAGLGNWSRTTDLPQGSTIPNSVVLAVLEGGTQANMIFVMTSPGGTGTFVGTDPLTFGSMVFVQGPIGLYYVGTELGDLPTIDAAVAAGEGSVTAGGTIFIVVRSDNNAWTAAGNPSGTHNIAILGQRAMNQEAAAPTVSVNLNGVTFTDSATRRYVSFIDIGVGNAATVGRNWAICALGCTLGVFVPSLTITFDTTAVVGGGSIDAPNDQPLFYARGCLVPETSSFQFASAGGGAAQRSFLLLDENIVYLDPALVTAEAMDVLFQNNTFYGKAISGDIFNFTAVSNNNLTFRNNSWQLSMNGSLDVVDGLHANALFEWTNEQISYTGGAANNLSFGANASHSGYPTVTQAHKLPIGDVPTGLVLVGGSWTVPAWQILRYNGTSFLPANAQGVQYVSQNIGAGTVNNLVLTDYYKTIRFATTGTVNITGIDSTPVSATLAERDGFEVLLTNNSVNNIGILNESGTSLAENRFLLPGGVFLMLRPGMSARFKYDFAVARWRLVSATTRPFLGAAALTDGTEGLVPQPAAGEQAFFLRGDGSWAEAIIQSALAANTIDNNVTLDAITLTPADYDNLDEAAVDMDIQNSPPGTTLGGLRFTLDRTTTPRSITYLTLHLYSSTGANFSLARFIQFVAGAGMAIATGGAFLRPWLDTTAAAPTGMTVKALLRDDGVGTTLYPLSAAYIYPA